MPQRAPSRLGAFFALAAVGLVAVATPSTAVHAQTTTGLAAGLDLLYLAVGAPLPLLPFLAGAGLYMRTGSHLVAMVFPALFFGAWAAFHFARLSVDGPWSGALFGLTSDGLFAGLVALAGSGYVRLIGAEARRLGTKRTAIAHGVGIAFAATAFFVLLVTHASDRAETGLYVAMLVLSLAVSAATGSFGGVVVTMAFALVAMVVGVWAAAVAGGARDAGQAFVAIFALPKLLLPVVVLSAIGWWLGGKFHARNGGVPPPS